MDRDAPLTLPRTARSVAGPRVEAGRQFRHAVVLLALVAGGLGTALAAGVRPQPAQAPTHAAAPSGPCTRAAPCQRSLVVVKTQPRRPATEALLRLPAVPGPDQGRS